MTDSIKNKEELDFFTKVYLVFVVCFGAFVLSYAAGKLWQKYQVETLLEGAAKGADRVFDERRHTYAKTAPVLVSIRETRSSGSYIRGLEMWQTALRNQARNDDAVWVTQLLASENSIIKYELARLGFTPQHIEAIHSKLSVVTPKLTQEESNVVEKLTSFDSLMFLAHTRIATGLAVTKHMHGSGTISQLFETIYVYMPGFAPDTLY